ncbi:hypothetical protein CBR_g53605 [Chara braunii]|uniref:Uncharacterized protein n=1 Tax=Chara braunii TaxID=69332 RepID=A0A388MB77_CHABU|nr:hypothetical protein CBR_g53605 [Chara braunii]|eukprot:GBG91753.1 hypothetical protein CBR_g53605 [Chara braunii]
MLCSTGLADSITSLKDVNGNDTAFPTFHEAAGTGCNPRALLHGPGQDLFNVESNRRRNPPNMMKRRALIRRRRMLQYEEAELQPVRFGDLEIAAISKFTRVWRDKNTGAKLYLAIFQADLTLLEQDRKWKVLGQLSRPSYAGITDTGVTIVARNVIQNQSNPILKPPVEYKRIWYSKNAGSHRHWPKKKTKHASVWRPIPAQGYICLGDMFAPGWFAPVPGQGLFSAHVCVREDCVKESAIGDFVWDDRGSHSTYDCSIWQIDNPGYNGSVESLVQGYIATDVYNAKPNQTVHVLSLPSSIKGMRYGGLEIGVTTLYVPTYNDRGSGGRRDVAFFTPALSRAEVDQGWRILSHVAVPH